MWWVALLGLGLVATVVATGIWHAALRPARIDARDMTPAKLGFAVSQPQSAALVDGVCGAFAGGFNAMISSRRESAWAEFSDGLPVLFRPFADEGAAMGYPLRRPGGFCPTRFEREVVARRPQYQYLHYVGLGFWHAMRKHEPRMLQRIVDRLDPLHGALCWDGYGFKHGFFDYEKRADWQARFQPLRGFARNAAYQGMGRSLWFRFMDDPDGLIRSVRSLDMYARDGAAGVGLAVVFTTIDRPMDAFAVLERMPEEWHGDVMLGMCFAYKARVLNDPAFFECHVATLDGPRREAIAAAVRQCDAIETAVRQAGGHDCYRRWRETLRDWLKEHIQYPFAGVTRAEGKLHERELTAA